MIRISAQARRCSFHSARRVFFFCGLALAASGGSAAELRGFVSEGAAGVLQYQACVGGAMSTQLFPIDDKTPNGSLRAGVGAVRQIMLHRYRPLYVEMRGDRGKTNITAHQFQRALGTVESCKTLPKDIAPKVQLLANGGPPAWQLVVTDATAILELPDKISLKLPVAAFKTVGLTQTTRDTLARNYDAQSAEGTPVRIEVNPQMCSDGRSETAYGARVTVRIEKRTFAGCAARF